MEGEPSCSPSSHNQCRVVPGPLGHVSPHCPQPVRPSPGACGVAASLPLPGARAPQTQGALQEGQQGYGPGPLWRGDEGSGRGKEVRAELTPLPIWSPGQAPGW